ncbi:MAG: protein-L-isoaspartate(D-aspartate) O-methyltransferase, partial [Planctomycetia bacterium]
GMWLAATWLAALIPALAGAAQPGGDRYVEARERMVRDDIAGGGVTDPRVLESMRLVPRHEFVGAPQRPYAYFDMALPIGASQTISGPFVVAYMTEKLEPKPTDRVLEIGTGSGYQAAVLSPLVGMVYSIEISRMLGEKAARTLARLGYRNVVTKIGDGFQGWPEHAPFDKIIVTCSPENIPQPLVDQLAEGGRMIIPVGERYEQTLVLLTKRKGVMEREALVPSLFVPMTGVAEEGRKVQPDGTRPELSNGGFEEVLPDSEVPAAWYYGRQISLVDGPDAPEGTRYLRLENAQPGRPAQLFQGFPVDGRAVGRVTFSLSVRGEGINAGPGPEDFPTLSVRFFNEERSRSLHGQVGPWKANGPWRRVEGTVSVPGWAREAIVQIGLQGATGRVDVDDVRVSGISR